MAADCLFVVGLAEENGRVHKDTEDDLDLVAEQTLQRCLLNEKGLRALDLSSTVFTTRFLTDLSDSLSHNTVLAELHMNGCRVGDEGVRLLSAGLAANKSNTLKVLSLDCNQIKCHGAAYLAKMVGARADRWTMSFGGYKTPSAGPAHGLQYLSLKGNEIGAVGVKSLAEVLMSGDDSMETLDLAGNKICDWGAGWLGMALRNHGAMRCLNLCSNPIGKDGIEELRGACSTATALLAIIPALGEASVPEMMANRKQPTVYLSQVQSRPPSASASRPSSAARSRPTSAAWSRPSSAARSRASSAQSTAPSVGFRRPGSASRKVPVTVRRPSRPPSAQTGTNPTFEGSGKQFFETADNLGIVTDEASELPVDDGEGNDVLPALSESDLKQEAPSRPASPVAEVATPARQRLDTSFRKTGRNGLPNPHWPPHPLRVAKARRAGVAPEPPPMTFTSPMFSAASAAAARLRPSERGVAADEAESNTVLSAASRFRWKLRDNGPDQTRIRGGSAVWLSSSGGPSGVAAAVARVMKRSESAPAVTRRCGALMGPAAAMAMGAWAPVP